MRKNFTVEQSLPELLHEYRPPYDFIVRDKVIYIEQPLSQQPIATIYVGNRDHDQMIALAEFICTSINMQNKRRS